MINKECKDVDPPETLKGIESLKSLIGEAVLNIEMRTEWEDIGLSIHPHPSFTETAAEMFRRCCFPLKLFLQPNKNEDWLG